MRKIGVTIRNFPKTTTIQAMFKHLFQVRLYFWEAVDQCLVNLIAMKAYEVSEFL